MPPGLDLHRPVLEIQIRTLKEVLHAVHDVAEIFEINAAITKCKRHTFDVRGKSETVRFFVGGVHLFDELFDERFGGRQPDCLPSSSRLSESRKLIRERERERERERDQIVSALPADCAS
jgi:hypothetical protein